jgi:F-type H+-transporting ATPase subunit delta
MNYGKIGVRYAKALFLEAVDENTLQQVYNDFQLIQQLISENSSFNDFLQTPILKPTEKKDFFTNVFQHHINDLSLRFLVLLTTHRRENRLTDIIRNFNLLYLKHNNTISAMLITPITANEIMLKQFTDLLQKTLQKTILLQNTVKPEIDGGFILQMDDKEYDASVRTQLNNIKEKLINTAVVNE